MFESLRQKKKELAAVVKPGGHSADELQEQAARIWKQYQAGQRWQDNFGLFRATENNINFFEGRQWQYNGQTLQTGGDVYPVENIITPITNYKVAVTCMNTMAIGYAPAWTVGASGRAQALAACATLEKKAAQLWEMNKLDMRLWEYVQDCAVSGDVFIYFKMPEFKPEAVDTTNIFFADEQNREVQDQPYIIIRERKLIDVIRREAKKNGLDEEQLELIRTDEDCSRELGVMAKMEIKEENSEEPGGKTVSLLKMWRDEESGNVCFCRSVKDIVYQPTQEVTGLELYPLVHGIWARQKGSGRGLSEVADIIPNQIEINKNLARRLFVSKNISYPRMVYNIDLLENPADMQVVGAPLGIQGSTGNIKDVIDYLRPPTIGADAMALSAELIDRTRELHNASDTALGSINPEKASGEAILAARDQAQVPLNWQKQNYWQLVEDIARVWFALIVAYNPNGLQVQYEDKEGNFMVESIDAATLAELQVRVRVDVSAVDPVSKRAAEKALETLFLNGYISFEEYVQALGESSNVPKAKLQEILEQRKAAMQQAPPEAQQPTLPPMDGAAPAAAPAAAMLEAEAALAADDRALMEVLRAPAQ